MGHLSLYRKYRSQTFSDLVGQGHVVRTLQNALTSGRIAHAYLFTGPRGTGKTSTARLLAKALNCQNGPTPEPCNQCASCLEITAGSSFDVSEIDAASESGVDDVRERIVAESQYPPSNSRFRIFIIDEVHDLSRNAFDALLKTIEEPPAHMIFILATTEFVKVPPTIRSRCQKFEFHRGSTVDLASRLKYVAESESIEIEPAALAAIARMADGGFRDALTLLEQAMLTSEGAITLTQVYDQLGLLADEAVDAMLLAMKEQRFDEIMGSLSEAIRVGRDPRAIVESMLHRLGDLMRAAYGLDAGVEGALNASNRDIAARLGMEAIAALRSELATTHKELRDITIPRLWLESELVRIARSWSAPISAPTPNPTPQGSQPKPQPARPVEPAPTAAIAAQPRTPAEPAAPVERTIEVETVVEKPELAEAAALWAATVKHVAAKSPSLGIKLTSTRVVEATDQKLVVAFERKIERDTAVDGPRGGEKRKFIVEKMLEVTGQERVVEYVVAERQTVEVEATTVELPAEGERLAELVKETLSGS